MEENASFLDTVPALLTGMDPDAKKVYIHLLMDPSLSYESYNNFTIQLFVIRPVLTEVHVQALESVHVSFNGRVINVN